MILDSFSFPGVFLFFVKGYFLSGDEGLSEMNLQGLSTGDFFREEVFWEWDY